LWEGCSNPVCVLILAEVAYDFPHAQTRSADLRCPTARFVRKVNPWALPHSQRFLEQFLRDVCDGSAIARRSRLEVSAQRLTEPHCRQHPRLWAARLRLGATCALAAAGGVGATTAEDTLPHDKFILLCRLIEYKRIQLSVWSPRSRLPVRRLPAIRSLWILGSSSVSCTKDRAPCQYYCWESRSAARAASATTAPRVPGNQNHSFLNPARRAYWRQ